MESVPNLLMKMYGADEVLGVIVRSCWRREVRPLDNGDIIMRGREQRFLQQSTVAERRGFSVRGF